MTYIKDRERAATNRAFTIAGVTRPGTLLFQTMLYICEAKTATSA